MPEASNLSEDKLQEAYQAWTKYGISLRKLESRFGVPKSSLQRAFKELKKAEGLPEIAGDEAHGESGIVTADPEIRELQSEVSALQSRVEKSEKLIALGKRKKELERRALELEARLDPSKLPNFIFTVIDEDYPQITFKLGRLCSLLGIPDEEAIDEAFDGASYEDWAIEQSEDVTFEDYATYHLRKWISMKAEFVEQEQKRAEEKEKLAEEKRRQELEEELRIILPRLRCPACRAGRFGSYTILEEQHPTIMAVYVRCADCLLYYRVNWTVNPFGADEVGLHSMPFARLPSQNTSVRGTSARPKVLLGIE